MQDEQVFEGGSRPCSSGPFDDGEACPEQGSGSFKQQTLNAGANYHDSPAARSRGKMPCSRTKFVASNTRSSFWTRQQEVPWATGPIAT